MTSAAIPAFLLGRRVTGRRWAAYLLALLAVCTPWIVYSTVVLTDVVAYPAFLWRSTCSTGRGVAVGAKRPARDRAASRSRSSRERSLRSCSLSSSACTRPVYHATGPGKLAARPRFLLCSGRSPPPSALLSAVYLPCSRPPFSATASRGTAGSQPDPVRQRGVSTPSSPQAPPGPSRFTQPTWPSGSGCSRSSSAPAG